MDIWEGTRFEGAFDWGGQTLLHPIAIAAVLVLGIALVVLPRRYAVLPMFILACFVSSRQRLVIMTIDFNLLRIMVLFGVVRFILKSKTESFTWRPIDTCLVLWTTSALIINTIANGTMDALINRLGYSFDALGMYFLFRVLVRGWEDVDRLIIGCIIVSIPVMAAFFVEKATGRNMFSIFGGVPEVTVIREGRLRCQGAFSHAILAGCFWASLLPLFAAQWWKGTSGKFWAVTGIVTTVSIVINCSSSTPVFGVAVALVGGLFFVFCRQMQIVRWGVLLTLIGLHMVMKAPVWHLISRVSAVGGSTGWHRFFLIDQTINHFNEWWLLGIRDTRHWGVVDITNQYILEGVRGGFLTLVLFIIVISLCFKEIGILWRRWSHDRYRVTLSWALGVSLFVHCMQFLGVSYFGQIYMVWYLLLAIIVSLASCQGPDIQGNGLVKQKAKSLSLRY